MRFFGNQRYYAVLKDELRDVAESVLVIPGFATRFVISVREIADPVPQGNDRIFPDDVRLQQLVEEILDGHVVQSIFLLLRLSDWLGVFLFVLYRDNSFEWVIHEQTIKFEIAH